MRIRRGRGALVAALATAALLAACDSTGNPFQPRNPGGGGPNGGTDAVAPAVDIQFPNQETRTVAVADSVFIRARVQDNVALDSVRFEGYVIRGNPDLGTAARVDRYVTKTVDLTQVGRAVRDTTLDRYLNATPDTIRDADVLIVVTAVDSAGNRAADTVHIAIGGPRVVVMQPAPGADFPAGTAFTLQVRAEDPRDLISAVRVRGTGSFTFDHNFNISPARAVFDTTYTVLIPGTAAAGALRIDASTTSGGNQQGVAVPVTVNILAATPDNVPPRVSFTLAIPQRVEQADSFAVSVSGVDDTRVDSVGVTVLAIRRNDATPDTVGRYVGRVQASGGTFRFGYAALGLNPLDSATVDLEVTAWARDPFGNCGAATAANTLQQLPCVTGPGGIRLSTGAGRLVQVFVARGLTIARPNGTDVVADLVADSQRVYLSNFSRNRVELLPLGATAYSGSVRVGSQPWGLAIGRTRDSLYVANSGGTNISVVYVRTPTPFEVEAQRIFTPNERLFGVIYDPLTEKTTEVTLRDYSDRPQFLAQASNGLLVYSTRPTAAAEDGTVRIYDPTKLRSEIFIGYVDRHTSGRATVVNADSAFFIPDSFIRVCPRRRFGDTSDPPCITGLITDVTDALTAMRAAAPNASGGRWDTRIDLGADIREVGLSDTTFVAASTDRDFVAVGEGATQNARVPMFEAVADSLVLRGDVRDLISNAAERVIGLGLNGDGSLGVARGQQAYFFTSTLRLQGVMDVGTPTGGVAMHPENTNYPAGALRLAFVSGSDAFGPFIDVLDTFNFFRIRRVYLRDPVVGALAVAPRAPGDPPSVALRLYALTTAGVLALQISASDFTSP